MDSVGPNLKDLETEVLHEYLILFVGFVVSTTLYGVTLLQGLFYFRTYAHNHWFMKLLTGVILTLDSLTTILPAHAIYFYLIKNFGNYLAGLSEPLTYRVENLMLTLITMLVQSFYTHQVWKLSGSIVLTAFLSVLVVVAFVLGLVTTGEILKNGSVSQLLQRDMLIIEGLVQGFAALCDISITISLCWLLHSKRTGIKQTESLVDRLIMLAINRGLVTTVAQICFLVLNVAAPGKFYWIPLHQSVGKLYTNSFLAMLNVRAYTTSGHTNLVNISGNRPRWSTFDNRGPFSSARELISMSAGASIVRWEIPPMDGQPDNSEPSQVKADKGVE